MSQNYYFNKLDADDNVFFGRELESVKARTFDIKYPEFKARKLIPTKSDVDPGAETIKYEQYDSIGIAKIINNYAKDFPRADIKGKEFISNVKSLGASYGYNLHEIRAARMAGKNLQTRKAAAARRAMFQKEESIAYYGDSSYNLGGLLTNANIPVSSTQSGAAFSTLTADQLVDELHAAASTIVENTQEVEAPDTLLLSTANYSLVSRRRVTDTNMTVLKYFLENDPYIKEVGSLNRLTEPTGGWSSLGLSFASGDLTLAYKRDEEKLTLEVPQDFEQFPPQEEGMDFVVHCHQRIGGVIIYYPLSLNIVEGC